MVVLTKGSIPCVVITSGFPFSVISITEINFSGGIAGTVKSTQFPFLVKETDGLFFPVSSFADSISDFKPGKYK